jgi:hypothetical protein
MRRGVQCWRTVAKRLDPRQNLPDFRREERTGNDAGLVGLSSPAGHNQGAASGAPTPRISSEGIMRKSQMPALLFPVNDEF